MDRSPVGLQSLSQRLEAEPTRSEDRRRRARLAEQLGQADIARQDQRRLVASLEERLANDPHNPVIAGELVAALASQRPEESPPRNSVDVEQDTFAALGDAYALGGQTQNAVSAFERALKRIATAVGRQRILAQAAKFGDVHRQLLQRIAEP